MADLSVLDVVVTLELLEAPHPSIVDILGVGDELGRRGRSIGKKGKKHWGQTFQCGGRVNGVRCNG